MTGKRSWFGKKKTALVLGGGGVKGVAHLGVLKYLEQNGYSDYDFIVGTSSGAIFGALFLSSSDVNEAYSRLSEVLTKLDTKKGLINITKNKSTFLANLKEKLYLAKSLLRISIIDEAPLREFLVALLGEKPQYSDLKLPLYVVATDLISGKDVVFSRGDLIPPLMASSAIPGAFPPIRYKNYLLIDGGRTQKLASGIASKLGAQKILGVDVGGHFLLKHRFNTSTQVIIRSEEITSKMLHIQNCRAVDLLIKPDFKKMKWHEFFRYKQAFEIGYREALKNKRELERFFKYRRKSGKRIESQKETVILE
jgi:NTE family protein